MFEEVFIDDVLNEIDRRSDEVIERFGICLLYTSPSPRD